MPLGPVEAAALIALLDAVAIVRALLRGHGVEGTLAWILAIVAFPGAGAATYLLFANPSVRRTTRRRRRFREGLRRSSPGRPSPGPEGPERGTVPHLAAQITGFPPADGNSVELLAGDVQSFERIEDSLRAARRFIWAEYFIIRNDETGARFLDLLAARARESIEVRLLYDGVGTPRPDRKRLAAIRAAGGRTEVFLPVNPLRRRWAVHLRNHRKIVVVDGEVGYTGGMNVGDEYSGRARRRGRRYFRDTHLALRGPAVHDLAWIFAEDWGFAAEETLEPPPPPPPIPGGARVTAIPSGPDQARNANALVYFSGIASAKRRCWIATAYFAPDGATIRALVSAALRGVDIRILTPARSDVALVTTAARSYYPELVAAGVRIFEYQPAMLHGKTMVVDGLWAIVGSANVDFRSFRLNFEVGALVEDAGFAARLERRFLVDLGASAEVKAQELEGRGFLTRLAQGGARLLSPIL